MTLPAPDEVLSPVQVGQLLAIPAKTIVALCARGDLAATNRVRALGKSRDTRSARCLWLPLPPGEPAKSGSSGRKHPQTTPSPPASTHHILPICVSGLARWAPSAYIYLTTSGTEPGRGG